MRPPAWPGCGRASVRCTEPCVYHSRFSPHRGRDVDVAFFDADDLIGCHCDAATLPGVVLDPFFGTGTVGFVAHRLGRN